MRKTKAVGMILAPVLLATAAAEVILASVGAEIAEDPRSIRKQLEIQENIRHASYVPDPDFGALLAPSRQFPVHTLDYRYTLRTDHAGFPNQDPWPQRVDVAVLGNSLITGAGVGYEGQFTTLLQDELGGGSVLNFGIPGGGTTHQLRTYRKYAAALQPKFVISMLWLTWEIDNSMKFHDWLDENPRPTDFTEYRHAYGETQPAVERAESAPAGPKRNTLRGLIQGSRVLRKLHRWSKTLRGIRDPVEQVVLANGDVLYLSVRDEKRLMRGWDRPNMPAIRQVFFEPLEQLQAEVEAKGGKLLVVLMPSKEELYSSAVFPEVLAPVQLARTELAERHIPVLDLYPLLGERGASRAVFFQRDMHPNAYGHQLVADELARAIGGSQD